jgi:hypothetical protein
MGEQMGVASYGPGTPGEASCWGPHHASASLSSACRQFFSQKIWPWSSNQAVPYLLRREDTFGLYLKMTELSKMH